MSSWWKERWFVVVALILSAIQLVITFLPAAMRFSR